MRRVFDTMGTVASVHVDGASTEATPAVLDDVERLFARMDAEYSRYRPDSPASQVADGRLALTRASSEHRDMYARAIAWRNATGGAFEPHRADRSVDLTGIVKAAAIEGAGALLRSAGHADWCVNVGGDVLVSGTVTGRDWNAGITDPDRAGEVLRVVRLAAPRRAVATSGTSERGEHVWRTDQDRVYRQVTVIADDVVTADVLSTAILAGGPATLRLAVEAWAVDVVTI
ncbi:thiamine biosynthesis lipoprotein [Curtobacterium sp. PhB136]|nr:thiamine biosynthesis lipoprotein [Curtobacterium sp. PhB136]